MVSSIFVWQMPSSYTNKNANDDIYNGGSIETNSVHTRFGSFSHFQLPEVTSFRISFQNNFSCKLFSWDNHQLSLSSWDENPFASPNKAGWYIQQIWTYHKYGIFNCKIKLSIFMICAQYLSDFYYRRITVMSLSKLR